MAPTDFSNVERQTDLIIECLLADEDDVDCRVSDAFMIESDCPAGASSSDDSFDPVIIADKLRTIADALNDDVKFKAALTDLKSAAAQEAVEAVFSQGVEALCKTQASQKPEVAPEMQLIRASVALGLYIKKSSPELKTKVGHVMGAFLKKRVGTWVAQQGGWDKVASD